MGPRDHVLDRVQIPPRKGVLWRGHTCMSTTVLYLSIGALHIIRLPPRANAFAVARGDKTAMRPFAKLLLKLVKSPVTRHRQ